jgi:hypothetical protein
MTVFVRPARESDAKNFTSWFLKTPSFDSTVFQFPDTYTLCAFTKSKIIGYAVVNFGFGIQVLSRMVFNPECSDLEKASASSELLKQVITIGYLNNLEHIYFVGDTEKTNRIASHVFTEVEYSDYMHVFSESKYPVYRLNLRELE